VPVLSRLVALLTFRYSHQGALWVYFHRVRINVSVLLGGVEWPGTTNSLFVATP